MKFTCDRCSKRFSSVDEPMPGRVYRIRCRCGNVIQITAPHATAPGRLVPRLAPGVSIDGARPAPPAISNAARGGAGRRATPAGDAAAPVRPAAAEARTPPATPGAAATPLTPAFDAGGEGAPLHWRDAEPLHALATPLEALAPGPMPGRDASADLEPAAPSERGLPSAGARRLEREGARDGRAVEDLGLAPAPTLPHEEPASEDPFLAAARAGFAGDFETTAPGTARRPVHHEPDARAEADAPPAGGGAREAARPDDTPSRPSPLDAPEGSAADAAAEAACAPPAVLAPPVDETSVELSVSEQYPLASPPATRTRRVALLAVAALALVAAIAGAAVHFLTRGEAPPMAAAIAVATRSSAPAAAQALAAADREAEEREATLRREEAARQEEARRAEAERLADAERIADAERRAEAARLADAERAEAERRAVAERAARTEKQVAAAPKPATAPPEAQHVQLAKGPPSPPVETASAETARREEDAPAPKADPLPEGLEPAQLQTVIRANRAALEDCAAGALRDPATAGYAGSKVIFVVLVAPDGRAEAALEDPALDESPFGECLRRAAARMTFPVFRGEPVGARIPLRIGAAP